MSFHSDPVLLEMTVQELVERVTAAEKRITHLESMLQHTVQHSPPFGQRPSQPTTMPSYNSPLQQQDAWYVGSTPSRSHDRFCSPLGGSESPATSIALSTQEEQHNSSLPRVVPVKPRACVNYMPSCNIDKLFLMPPSDVIRKYSKLRGETKAGKLAVKLAKEAFFGDKILVQCTVSGCRELPALPVQELSELKQTMLQQYPKFWNSPQEFEQVWTTCCEAIGQAAKALRKKGH